MLAILMAVLPGPLSAQSQPVPGGLAGVVVTEDDERPLEGASVILVDRERATSSDKDGHFVFSELQPGAVEIEVHLIGHASSFGRVEIRSGETAEVQITLSTEAIPLDLEEDIKLRNPTRLTDMLREAGLEVTANGTSLLSRRGNCAPAVYLNGTRVSPRIRGPGSPSRGVEAADAANLMTPSLVTAVEVYRSYAETPGQYADRHAPCGVVLIWTRH